MKFAFIRDLDEEEQRKPREERIPVSLMCEVLEVSRGGFYAWLTRAKPDRAKEDAGLTEIIKRIHDEHEGRLGIDRLVAELARLGTQHGVLRSELPIQHEVGHDDTLARPQQKINSTRRRSPHTSPTDTS